MPTLVELWLGRGTGTLERTPLVIPILTFFFFILVFQLQLPLESEYVLLFMVGAITLLIFEAVMRRKTSFDIPNYTVSQSILPIMVGISVVGVPFLIIVFFTGTQPTPSGESFADQFRNFVTQVFVIAVTEEFYFRWVLPKIYGGVLPQVLFAASHPAVRTLLVAGQWGAALPPFFFYILFGLSFQQLVFMGQASDVPAKWRKYFGLPLTNGMHGMLNTIAVLFTSLSIVGIAMQPFIIWLMHIL